MTFQVFHSANQDGDDDSDCNNNEHDSHDDSDDNGGETIGVEDAMEQQ